MISDRLNVPDHNAETAFKLKVLSAISDGLRSEAPGALVLDLAAKEIRVQTPAHEPLTERN